jgi:hypothetical protein
VREPDSDLEEEKLIHISMSNFFAALFYIRYAWSWKGSKAWSLFMEELQQSRLKSTMLEDKSGKALRYSKGIRQNPWSLDLETHVPRKQMSQFKIWWVSKQWQGEGVKSVRIDQKGTSAPGGTRGWGGENNDPGPP